MLVDRVLADLDLPADEERGLDRLTIAKLALLLEGEGCFSWDSHTPTIRIGMTDRDVIEWVASVWGSRVKKVSTVAREARGHRPLYYTQVSSVAAIGWMMVLYTDLFSRRRAQIRGVLAEWRSRPTFNRLKVACIRGHALIPQPHNPRHRYCPICKHRTPRKRVRHAR